MFNKLKGQLARLFDPALNLYMVAKVLGVFLTLFSFLMILPPIVQLLMGEGIVGEKGDNAFFGFGLSAALGGVIGAVLFRIGRNSKAEFFRREGLLAVALVWILSGVLGGLPFYFTEVVGSVWDGIFESISGMTTTGSSIMGAGDNWAIGDLPVAITFWRSLLHWLGGIGIVVMFLVFLPALGITEKKLFQAEVAGVSKEGMKPRIRESASALVRIYLYITVFLALGYWLLGMGGFDAMCHSFGTIATGGFSTKNGSIAEFGSGWIELLVIVGMFMAATNFGLYHRVESRFKKAAKGGLIPKWADMPSPKEIWNIFWKDPEWRFYFLLTIGASLLIGMVLWIGGGAPVPSAGFDRVHDYATLDGSMRDSVFQTVSLVSSTGFANCNLLAWPILAQFLIAVLMFGGGCSGSTGGGFKLARVLVLFNYVGFVLRRFIRPRSVEPMQIRGQKVDAGMLEAIFALFILWVLVLVFGTAALLFLEPQVDLMTGFTSVLSCISNMGPGLTQLIPGSLDAVNPMGAPANALALDCSSYGSFGLYSSSTKTMLAFIMILGRLEIYTPLIIFFPSFWKD